MFVVVVPKADLHTKPSFSSPVVVTVSKGTLLRVSARKVVGPDGVGVFYPVQGPSGHRGYVSDVEIEPAPTKTEPAPKAAGTSATAPGPVAVSRPTSPAPLPIESQGADKETEKGHLALGVGLLNYAEYYRSQLYQAHRISLVLGRHLASDWFGGMRSDFQIAFSPGPPKFLTSVGAEGDSAGYFASVDYQLQKRFLKQSSFQFFLGLGVSVIHTQFQTSLLGVPYSSTSTRPGANLGFGALWNGSSWGLSFEVRNYFERAIYQNVQLSLLLY